ncbi:MAG: hypothetical protein ABEH35_06265 [Haloarculaceae archaeon]
MTSDGESNRRRVAERSQPGGSKSGPLRTDGGSQPLLDRSLRTFPWPRAVGAAVVTFLVEYLLVAVIFVVGPSSVDRSAPTIRSTVDVIVQYGHILYNAHHVPTLTRANAQIAGSPLGNDLYFAENPATPPIVFFALPVVALAVAGWLFEQRRSSERVDPSRIKEGLLVGTGFTVGYLLVGIVGALTLVQTWPLVVDGETIGQAAQAPYLWASIVAFFLFPMVFVSVGAALSYVGRTDESHDTLSGDSPDTDTGDGPGVETDDGPDGQGSGESRTRPGDETGAADPTLVVSRVDDEQA